MGLVGHDSKFRCFINCEEFNWFSPNLGVLLIVKNLTGFHLIWMLY